MMGKNNLVKAVLITIALFVSMISIASALGSIPIPVTAQTVPTEIIWVNDGATVYQMNVRLDATEFSEAISNVQWEFSIPTYISFVDAVFPGEDFFFEGTILDPALSDPVFQSQTDADGNIISITGTILTETGAPDILNGNGILASYLFTVDIDAPESQFNLNSVAIGYVNPNFPPDINCPGGTGAVGAICPGFPDTIENFPFTIVPVNSPPVLDPIGNQIVNEGQPLQFTITFSDPDVGDTVTCSASNLPLGANFDVPACTFSWTPTFDDAGDYIVTFNVTDGQLSDSEAITITVNNVNRPPVLGFIGNQVVKVGGVFYLDINAVDPDGDTLTYYTDALEVLPQPVKFSSLLGVLKWMPSNNSCKDRYKVAFSVTDGEFWDSETISIFVQPLCKLCSNPTSLLAYYNCRFPLHISPVHLSPLF